MTTPFTSWPLKIVYPPTGGVTTPNPRPLPVQLADVINVKDFGAVGNGTADDTAAIQFALDTAWKTAGAVNAGDNRRLNRPVFFPAGKYKITSTLVIGCHGSWMKGEGSRTTQLISGADSGGNTIKSKAASPLGAVRKSLVFTNGWGNTRCEGIGFIMTDGNSVSDDTVCFNWNWQVPGGSVPNTQACLWIDCGFSGGTFGFTVADPGDGSWGNECDTSNWINCWFDNCNCAIFHNGGNALNCMIIGGSVTNCSGIGIRNAAVGIGTLAGISFHNNAADMEINGMPCSVIGCYSDSAKFAIVTSMADFTGCVYAGTGAIVQGAPEKGFTMSDCKFGGTFTGTSDAFIRQTEFTHANWWGSANICELRARSVETYANTPPAANAAEGLCVSITDSSVATWSSTVTGGGGTRALLNASGTKARGTITFSAQPAHNSKITFTGYSGTPFEVTMQDFSITAVAIANAGVGGTNGTGGFTVVGGTLASPGGTPATVSVTISGGAMTVVSVLDGGRYAVPPPDPASLSGSGIPAGATLNLALNPNRATGFRPGVFRGTSLAQCLANVKTAFNVDGILFGATGARVSSSSNMLTFEATHYGTGGNSFSLAASTSPASNGTVSPGTGVFAGGTAPVWTLVGR